MALFLIILNNNKKSGFGGPIYKKFLWIAQVGVPLKIVIGTASSIPPKPCLPPEKMMSLLCVNAKWLQ